MNAFIARPSRPATQFFRIGLALWCFVSVTACGGSDGPPAGGGSSNGASPVNGVCFNPYYPVSPTAKRKYRIDYSNGGPEPADYTESFTDITSDSFTMRSDFADGVTLNNSWKCTGDGLAAQQYAQVSMSDANFKLETLDSSGVTIPQASRWRVGERWESSYRVTGKMTQGGATTGEASGTISISNEIVGREPVTVPAGTFDAFKVRSTFVQKMEMKIGSGMNMPVNNSFTATVWFGSGVGMVKSVFEDFATTELISAVE